MEWSEVQGRIQAGERRRLEFKARFDTSKVGRAVCAFANTDGGVVVLGVSDSGEVLGVNRDPDTVHERLTDFLNDGFQLSGHRAVRTPPDRRGLGALAPRSPAAKPGADAVPRCGLGASGAQQRPAITERASGAAQPVRVRDDGRADHQDGDDGRPRRGVIPPPSPESGIRGAAHGAARHRSRLPQLRARPRPRRPAGPHPVRDSRLRPGAAAIPQHERLAGAKHGVRRQSEKSRHSGCRGRAGTARRAGRDDHELGRAALASGRSTATYDATISPCCRWTRCARPSSTPSSTATTRSPGLRSWWTCFLIAPRSRVPGRCRTESASECSDREE